jgi:hypothetical protein
MWSTSLTNTNIQLSIFMSAIYQVGSKFGENTSRWGSMLSDGQVGKLSDILPGPAAGFFSSFTSGV